MVFFGEETSFVWQQRAKVDHAPYAFLVLQVCHLKCGKNLESVLWSHVEFDMAFLCFLLQSYGPIFHQKWCIIFLRLMFLFFLHLKTKLWSYFPLNLNFFQKHFTNIAITHFPLPCEVQVFLWINYALSLSHKCGNEKKKYAYSTVEIIHVD